MWEINIRWIGVSKGAVSSPVQHFISLIQLTCLISCSLAYTINGTLFIKMESPYLWKNLTSL